MVEKKKMEYTLYRAPPAKGNKIVGENLKEKVHNTY